MEAEIVKNINWKQDVYINVKNYWGMHHVQLCTNISASVNLVCCSLLSCTGIKLFRLFRSTASWLLGILGKPNEEWLHLLTGRSFHTTWKDGRTDVQMEKAKEKRSKRLTEVQLSWLVLFCLMSRAGTANFCIHLANSLLDKVQSASKPIKHWALMSKRHMPHLWMKPLGADS